MSMFDPRMKHLVDNEGLRGLGAYWIIIEQLSILPEPRAQLDYLRADCDSKKITLCYLKKIILEYDLFELEEDGYFMPKELNPLHKKGEKTEKTTQEKPDSKAKNDEKQQKVSRNKSKKQSDLSSNTLNNKYLAKNATNTNKKTIDINKTTTATTESFHWPQYALIRHVTTKHHIYPTPNFFHKQQQQQQQYKQYKQ